MQTTDMATATLSRLSRAFRFRLGRQSIRSWRGPGLAGLACLGLALVVARVWLPALQRESDALETAIRAESRRAAMLSARHLATATAPPALPVSQRFQEAFPAATERQSRLAVLLSVATKHGLEAKRSELRLSQERGLDLLRYTVTLPVVGPYAKVRAFMAEAQDRDPALSLDRLRLRRASPSASSVECDLTWSFYMQTGTAPTTPDLSGPRPETRSAPR